ncbi:MAG: hypothetical protein ABR591_15215 [Candidatus Velthaea sp.]
MPSDNGHAASAIIGFVAELEASTVAAEEALVQRDWTVLENLLAEQRRLTHAISNAVALSDGERPAAFDAELHRRLATLETRRGDQMRRLTAFHAAVGERLAVVARAKVMRRASKPLDAVRPALLNSLR